MKKAGNLLIIDDDEFILVSLKLLLEEHYTMVDTISEPAKIEALLSEKAYHVVLLDMNFSQGETSGREGLDLLAKIKSVDPHINVIMMTAYGEVDTAVKAMKAGALDFITKPWHNERLLATVNNALNLSEQQQEIRQLKSRQAVLNKPSPTAFAGIIGTSHAMRSVMAFIEKVGPTDANVLILGENGTGKEVAARALHKASPRAEEVFISVDLGAIPGNLFESELFGHKKGAFTDAKEDRMGRFEAAKGGTLFLDEIGNLPLEQQSKLLTVLQSRKVTKVGSNTAVEIDARIISATNRDLLSMVKAGEFREDLFYRINTMEVTMPPLRDRAGDIGLLGGHFLEIYAKKYQKIGLSLSKEVIQALESYEWPGNVRELQHSLERAVIMSEENTIKVGDLNLAKVNDLNASEFEDYNLEDLEAWAIKKALMKHNGNVSHAAKELGLSRGAMYRRMEKYGL